MGSRKREHREEMRDITRATPPGAGTPIRTVRASAGFGPRGRDIPEVVTRQWVVEHSADGDLGLVQLTPEQQDGVFTHARYRAECTHFIKVEVEDIDFGHCNENEEVNWKLDGFEG